MRNEVLATRFRSHGHSALSSSALKRKSNAYYKSTCHCATTSTSSEMSRGPSDPPPDYSSIDKSPLNRVVYTLFRGRMAKALGTDSKMSGYSAIIDMTRQLNSLQPIKTQEITRAILMSLFPTWLPGAFKVLFSKPFPHFSCQMNAWATWLTCQWLMGPCEINDVPINGGDIGKGMGVLVKRCRYLEESGCASICINSCKIPTQRFFDLDMGLPLTMTPDYETFECQFAFGATPPEDKEDGAFDTPCFPQCPKWMPDTRCHRIQL